MVNIARLKTGAAQFINTLTLLLLNHSEEEYGKDLSWSAIVDGASYILAIISYPPVPRSVTTLAYTVHARSEWCQV
jgi:hypothetical protein